MNAAPTVPRRVAFEALRRTFEDGAWTDRAFRAAADRAGLEGRERAQAQHLAYGAVQMRGREDAAIAELAGRELSRLDPPVVAALRLGLYELLFSGGSADHAAVDQAVELAKRAGAGPGSGLVNAVLRRAAAEREVLLEAGSDSDPEGAAARHSVPLWLAELWWRELGPAEALSLIAAANRPGEVAMRVNTLRADPAEVLAELRAEGAEAHRPAAPAPLAAEEILVLDGRAAAPVQSRIEAGVLVPHSRGSAAVVELLDPRPGERVLDLCAGPGVKSGQIAARLENSGEVVSVEIDPGRLAELERSMALLGADCVRAIHADAAEADFGEGFDRVLLDPPCSDLGTLASRPDARWRKSPELIAELAELQGRMLRRAASALRPGGTLVYSTCTISRAENEEPAAGLVEAAERGEVPSLRADHLGERFPGLTSVPDPRFLQVRPDRDRTSGFFLARFIGDD